MVPGGFHACIETDGDQPCPAGFPNPHHAGDDSMLECSACTCQTSGSCDKPTIKFYGDQNCNNQTGGPLKADGSCQGAQGGVATFEYTANVNGAKCTAMGPNTPTITITNERTVCCK
jgi:hypothetical protein